MEVGALAFLAGHDMDFNKWIKEGVTYLGKNEEINLTREELHDNSGEMIELTEKKYMEESEKEFAVIEKWIKDDTSNQHFVPGNNSYIRKYYYQQLRKKYPNFLFEHTTAEKAEGILIIKPLSDKEKVEYNKRKQGEIAAKIGFRNVFKAICESHLPIVGHNCFYDFLFLYSTFEDILPHFLSEYKELFSKLFVEVYDTKYVYTDSKITEFFKLQFQDSVLESIYAVSLKAEQPKIEFGEGFAKYAKTVCCHEAGYDSYMTGYCFLKMREIIKEDIKKYKGMINCYNGLYIFNMNGDDLLKFETVVAVAKEDIMLTDAYKKLEDIKQYAIIRITDEKNAIIVSFDHSIEAKQKELVMESLNKIDNAKVMSWKDYSEMKIVKMMSQERYDKKPFKGKKNFAKRGNKH